MTAEPFAGKWTLATADGLLVTLVDAASGLLGLAAPAQNPAGVDQAVNAYGDPATGMRLQAGNWRDVVGQGDTWTATAGSETPPSTFVLDPVDASGCRILEHADDGDFWWVADGSTLGRLPTSGSPPAEATFTQAVLTAGLADIMADGALSDDLRGVVFAGADLTNVRMIASDLSDARLVGATVTGAVLQNCTVTRTDFSGLDLDNVVMSGIEGADANFSGTTLHRSTNLQGAQLATANFREATSTGTGLASGPAMGNLVAPGADFSEASLVGVAMSGSTLTGATLTRADLSSGQLADIDFTGASLDGVILRDAVLSQSVFATAQLVGGDFTGSQITDCSFVGANLTNARLSGAKPNLGRVDLTGATLIATILSGLDLTGVVFDDTTVFMQAQLDGVNLTGQVLDRVDFFFANLHGATLDSTSAEGTNFASADLSGISALAGGQGVSFLGCNLSNAKLADARLKGARFGVTDQAAAAVLTNLYMPNADLTSANLVAVDLSGAQWYGPDAKANANLQDATLSRANLATMDLSQASLDGADLSFANLVNTNLAGASLTPTTQRRAASLAFASMQGTDLTEAHLPSANLTNAAVALAVTGPAADFVGVPLFDLPVALTTSLDAARIDTALTTAFATAGYPLVAAATITVAGVGVQWSIDNWDQSATAVLQSGYGGFVLVLTTDAPTIRVYGASPLLVIATDEHNQQLQQSQTFTATAGLEDALDDQSTCPSGMRWSMRTRGVDVLTLMTPALPPHPPVCVPSLTHWC